MGEGSAGDAAGRRSRWSMRTHLLGQAGLTLAVSAAAGVVLTTRAYSSADAGHPPAQRAAGRRPGRRARSHRREPGRGPGAGAPDPGDARLPGGPGVAPEHPEPASTPDQVDVTSVRDAIRLAKGRFSVTPQEPTGTVVEVQVPVH